MKRSPNTDPCGNVMQEVAPHLGLAAIHRARRDFGAAALERALRADPGNVQALRDLEGMSDAVEGRS